MEAPSLPPLDWILYLCWSIPLIGFEHYIMPAAHILFCHCHEEVSSRDIALAVEKLPLSVKERITRYIAIRDRLVRIAGKLLLRRILMTRFSMPENILEQMFFEQNNKPVLVNTIDFSIAHSGSLVVCAVTDGGKIGVDVEQIIQTEIAVYEEYFSGREYHQIVSARDPSRALLQAWVRKEAVLKAIGAGVLMPMQDVDQTTNMIHLGKDIFHLHDLTLKNNFAGAYATNFPNCVQDTGEISIDEVLRF